MGAGPGVTGKREAPAGRPASRRVWLSLLAAGLVLLAILLVAAGVLLVQGRVAVAAVVLGAAQLLLLLAVAVYVRRLAGLTSRGFSRLSARVASAPEGRAVDSASARVAKGPAGQTSANDLVETGIFDADFYSAAANRTFRDPEEAASHFLSVGMAELLPPHPLVLVGRLPQAVRDTWREGDIDGVLAFLRQDRATLPALGPLFDPKLLPAAPDGSEEHPGGCLGSFLESASDDTLLPAPRRSVRWGDVRRAAGEYSSEFRRTAVLRRPRTTRTWNAAKEEEWRRAVSDVSLSVGSDGHPSVSVIMPAWNRESEVAGAIRSVQSQGLQAWELVVVDDGSDDQTASVVRSLAAGDARVRLVERAHAGLSAARNAGLAAATGEFVAFLDTDHRWEPDFLELMLGGLQHTGASAAYSAIELRTGDTSSYQAYRGGLQHLLVRNHIDLNVFVARRSLVEGAGGFDEELPRGVDHDLAIRVAEREEPVLFPFVGCRYDRPDADAPRVTTTESDNWQFAAIGKNLVDWDGLLAKGDAAVPGRISVVIPTYQDHLMTAAAVDSVLRMPGDLEVVVVDNGSTFVVGTVLAQLWAGDPRVRVLHLPKNLNFGIGSNLGVAAATGEYVFFLNNDTVAPEQGPEVLVGRLSDPDCLGVQPLLLYGDDSVQAAGTIFVADNHLPLHHLAGMPPEDAHGVGSMRFAVVTAAALLMRRADVLRLRGFDPRFVNGMEDVDLCLRAGAASQTGYFAVEPAVRFQHRESKTPARGKNLDDNRRLFMDRWWGRLPSPDLDKLAAANLRVTRIQTDGRVIPSLRPVLVRDRPGPGLRWGLRHAAPGGPSGNRWGDTAYVESLASALRRAGQEVVTYRHGANRETAHVFDDVSVVLRGLDQVAPIPGVVNVLWVISHPELLTPLEVRGFDLVFAASASWSEQFSRRAGREILPLLQATDVDRFVPRAPGDGFSRPAVFVGGNHSGRERTIVTDALAAGVDLRVIGGGWADVVPAPVLEADHVDNRDLSAVYRSASRVLADHWPEMAELGFIQNRLFDAVASGARVISDEVAGLREVFGSAVQTYDGPDELRHLCSPEGALRFGTDEEILQQAKEVRAHHSFDARAQVLLEAVESVRSRQ